jgi:hypothetical protein
MRVNRKENIKAAKKAKGGKYLTMSLSPSQTINFPKNSNIDVRDSIIFFLLFIQDAAETLAASQ